MNITNKDSKLDISIQTSILF